MNPNDTLYYAAIAIILISAYYIYNSYWGDL